MKKETNKKVTLYIDSDIYLKYKIYATTLNISVSQLVEDHMKEVLKELKKNEENKIKKVC